MQKSAYGMRISDGSSDVCSSDLLRGGEDVDVGRARVRSVQRAHVDEGDRRAGAGVMAPQRYPAAGAAHDLLSLAAAGRRVDGVRLAAKQSDTGGRDHRVEPESDDGVAVAPPDAAARNEQQQTGAEDGNGA